MFQSHPAAMEDGLEATCVAPEHRGRHVVRTGGRAGERWGILSGRLVAEREREGVVPFDAFPLPVGRVLFVWTGLWGGGEACLQWRVLALGKLNGGEAVSGGYFCLSVLGSGDRVFGVEKGYGVGDAELEGSRAGKTRRWGGAGGLR